MKKTLYDLVGLVDDIGSNEDDHEGTVSFEERITPGLEPANVITISSSEWHMLGRPVCITVKIRSAE